MTDDHPRTAELLRATPGWREAVLGRLQPAGHDLLRMVGEAATGAQAALGEAWGAKQRARVEKAWHAAVLAAALTLALPMRGPGVLTSGPPVADEQPLVEKALQVMVTLRVRVRG